MAGHVFFLNGGSSVGKTSLALALQAASAIPLLRTGTDHFFATVPDRWGGGNAGPLSRAGFHYLDLPDGQGTRIGYGRDGWRMLRGHHRAVRALAEEGNAVVVDELMLGRDVHADWLEALEGVVVTWVRVHCSLDVDETRERQRGQRQGLARGTHAVVHDGVLYDLEVDTSELTPALAARAVLDCARDLSAAGGPTT